MVPGQNPFAMQKAVLESRVKNRASWLTYAAGYSLINQILVVLHIPIYFLGGLGIAAIMANIVNAGIGISFILTLIPAAVFAFFGMQAAKRQFWAFYVGMALYALDGVLLLKVSDYLSVAFHAYVLYRVFEGLSAARQLNALEASAGQAHFAAAPQPGAWPPPPSQGYPAPGAYPQPQAPGNWPPAGAGQPQPGWGQQPAAPAQPGWGQQPAAPAQPSWGQQPGAVAPPAQPSDWANQPQQPRNLDGS